jgi:hypothetical protein
MILVARSLGRWVLVGKRVELRWVLVVRPVFVERSTLLCRRMLVARPAGRQVFVDRRWGGVIGTLSGRNRTPVHFAFFFS